MRGGRSMTAENIWIKQYDHMIEKLTISQTSVPHCDGTLIKPLPSFPILDKRTTVVIRTYPE